MADKDSIPEYLYVVWTDNEWPIDIMKSESAAIRQYEKRGKSDAIASLQEVHIGLVKLEFQYELEVVPPTEPTLRKLDGDGEERQED